MKLKNNKKGEFRIHHLIIAVLVMGLFGIFLMNMTSDFVITHSNGSITAENLTTSGLEGNKTAFDVQMATLSDMTDNLTGISGNAPGGASSSDSSENADAEGATIKAGYKFISNLGNWLFIYPAGFVRVVLTFFGLPQEFAMVATTIIFVVVAIVLISSILKNRI